MSMTSSDDPIIRVWGPRHSPAAYALRDFLARSVITYDWRELGNDAEARRVPGIEGLADPRLPVVQLPDGRTLHSASVPELAHALGFVTAPRHREYDISIYGAGPAGLSAAVYAASEGLRTVLIERDAVGGQAGSSSLIENYMGFPRGIAGSDLAERAREQAVRFGAEILQIREGVKARFVDGRIIVDLAQGGQITARSNICATGVEWRRLGLPGEDRLRGRGVHYGAGASEAALCRGETVYVVGGGNSAGQAAMHFSAFADEVVMLVRGQDLAATLSTYLVEKIERQTNIRVETDTKVQEVIGEDCLEAIVVERGDGSRTTLHASRLFICIGGQPNTEWAKDTAILRDTAGYLVTGSDLLNPSNALPECWQLDRMPYYLETSVPGSFAAGDVRQNSIKRVASAVGEGAMAVAFVHQFLSNPTATER